jgi:hypothetical protein
MKIFAPNAALYPTGSFRRLSMTAALLCVGIASAVAEGSKLYVFWDTVSPDGKYAIAWSTTGEATLEDLPSPDDHDPVANYVIEVASRKIVVQLAGGHYWGLDGHHPNHRSLETVWSENSRLMLAIYDSRWSTDTVLLVDVSVPRAIRIENQLEDSFRQMLKSTRWNEYTKYEDSLLTTFDSPWFVGPERLYLLANASIPKKENPAFNSGLYFQIKDGGTSVTLLKFEPSSGEESADRSLNRTYRQLHGLLSAADQKLLVKEERDWLLKRDAVKSEQQKKAFIVARTQELQTRVENVKDAREKGRQ